MDFFFRWPNGGHQPLRLVQAGHLIWPFSALRSCTVTEEIVEVPRWKHKELLFDGFWETWTPKQNKGGEGVVYPEYPWEMMIPSGKLTWQWKMSLFEDVFPIEHGHFPASHVSWPQGMPLNFEGCRFLVEWSPAQVRIWRPGDLNFSPRFGPSQIWYKSSHSPCIAGCHRVLLCQFSRKLWGRHWGFHPF